MAYLLLGSACVIVMITGWTERRGYIRTGLFRSDWIATVIGVSAGVLLLTIILSLVF